MTRPGGAKKRAEQGRVIYQEETKREKMLRKAADLEQQAKRARHMAMQLSDVAHDAMVEAITIRALWRE